MFQLTIFVDFYEHSVHFKRRLKAVVGLTFRRFRNAQTVKLIEIRMIFTGFVLLSVYLHVSTFCYDLDENKRALIVPPKERVGM